MDACYSQFALDPKYICTYSNNKTELKAADVVLFRGRRLEQIPLPSYRRANQTWVFWEFEPPYKVWMHTNLTKYNGVFNLTMTHMLRSDLPYSFYLKRQCVRNEQRYQQLAGVDFAVNKTRAVHVAWMVSVCKTQSRREDYVRELRKHIKVDVYGKCGQKSCGSNNMSTWGRDRCDQRLLHGANSYRFYLAFENSLCEDYISEKLWRMLSLNVVPVVMGGVDYSTLLPSDTFIDTKDFKSPEHLAGFLKHLVEDRDEYNGYIRRKNALDCFSTEGFEPKQCYLCRRLHEIHNQGRRVHRVAYNLSALYSDRHCAKPLIAR
jgi:hypothetical protein